MSHPIEPDRRLEGAFLVGRRVVDGWLTIRAGRIVDRGEGPPPAPARGAPAGEAWAAAVPERIGQASVLAPGFIDLHVHGSGGANAMAGRPALQRMAVALARRGVTSFLPTAVTAPLADLAGFAADVRAARAVGDESDPRSGPGQARILGAHLEGPAIDPEHRGAHDPHEIVDPSVLLAAWLVDDQRWAGVRVVTLAPERPGGLELVRYLRSRGVIASIGHSGATFDQARAAYAAGARSTTHLFNAMTGLGHRAPGVVGAALDDPRATVELIADGVHVDRAIWPLVWRTAGSRLLLVSDAIDAAGQGDGASRLGPIALTVRDGRATTPGGALAGSTISVADAVANLVGAGLALPRAVGAATLTPARLLGRRDLGRLAVGARADLVVLDRAGRVERTMIGGRWLDQPG